MPAGKLFAARGNNSALRQKLTGESDGSTAAGTTAAVKTVAQSVQFKGRAAPELYLTDAGRTRRAEGESDGYKSRKGEVKTTLHWGRRALLLSEMQLLLRVAGEFDKPVTVVYAGSAPGTHLPWLAKKFERHVQEWVLVDPDRHDSRCSRIENVDIRKEEFTDEMAEELKAKRAHGPVVFISDVRTGESGTIVYEKGVRRSMRDQHRWRDILDPDYAMLKFRLPFMTIEGADGETHHYKHRETEYLDGEVQLLIWMGQTSTEARLIVPRGAPTRMYDNKVYEDQMYFHNKVVREQYHYDHDVPKKTELDHRWDARAEIEVLTQLAQYLAKVEGRVAEGAEYTPSADEVTALAEDVTRALGKTFTKAFKSMNDKVMQYAREKTAEEAEEASRLLHMAANERQQPVWWRNAP